MVIFVVQNLQDAKISFLAFSGRFPLALALLVAAALGALVVFCLGIGAHRPASQGVSAPPGDA